ncbi:MAG TPA: protein phosphatase 2C domain-containing protein [Actinocrinis sp.]|nr:protein phosphatase 2C domain-containing protein [Actinocrinis sp.]
MTGHWQVLSAAVAGADHARRGEACRDSFAVEQAHGAFIAAVADGGEGLRLSAAGATFAAAMAAGAARRLLAAAADEATRGARFWGDLVRDLAEGLPDAFGRLAQGAASLFPEAEPRDFGATLTLAIAAPPWLAVLSLGDGFVVTRSGGGHLDLLLPPEPGGAAFVSSPGAAAAAHTLVARIADLTGIAVSTTGLRELGLVYEGAIAHHPREDFFDPVFARAETDGDGADLLRLLASEQVCSVTGSDKTLVVAVPTRAGASA